MTVPPQHIWAISGTKARLVLELSPGDSDPSYSLASFKTDPFIANQHTRSTQFRSCCRGLLLRRLARHCPACKSLLSCTVLSTPLAWSPFCAALIRNSDDAAPPSGEPRREERELEEGGVEPKGSMLHPFVGCRKFHSPPPQCNRGAPHGLKEMNQREGLRQTHGGGGRGTWAQALRTHLHGTAQPPS